MFDIQIFRRVFSANSILLTQVRSYVDGSEVPLEQPIELTFERHGNGRADGMSMAHACDGLKKYLNKGLGARRKRAFALVLDEEGIAAIERWSVHALGVLASREVDDVGRAIRPVGPDGRVLNLGDLTYESAGESGGLLGYFANSGDLDVVSSGRFVAAAHAGSRGWVVLAPRLRLQHRGRACESMMTCLEEMGGRPMAATHKLEYLFWSELAPGLPDPFLRQEPLYIAGEDKPDLNRNFAHVQPKPEIAYAVGDAQLLVDLLYKVLGMTIESRDPDLHRDWVAAYGAWPIILHAAHGAEPARLFCSSYDMPEATGCLINRILGIMRPTGYQLAGGPKMSEARQVPAEMNCVLSDEGLGLSDNGIWHAPSGHERIARIGAITEFLISNGVSEEEAAALVDAI